MEKNLHDLFAFCGLMVMIIGYREIPFIALGFGAFFHFIRLSKSVFLNPIQSLLYETLFLRLLP